MTSTSIISFTLTPKKPREKSSKARKLLLQEKEKKLDEKMKELKEREAVILATEQKMKEHVEYMGMGAKTQWKEAEEMMNNATKLWQIVHMNMATLLQFQNNLQEQQQMQLTMGPQIEELAPIPSGINFQELYNRLQYCIPMAIQNVATGPIAPLPKLTFDPHFFDGGELLSPVNKNQIMEWLPQLKFTLIYQATRDGFEAKDFHEHCDNKGRTLVVIQSNDGHLFGGFSSLAWKNTVGYVSRDDMTPRNSDSFLFTLSNPNSLPPTRYPLKPYHGPRTIYCDPNYCAVFGENDIFIASGSNECEESFSNFPRSFVDSTGSGNHTFAGSRHFSTSEIEVYSVA